MNWIPDALPYVLPFAVGILTLALNGVSNRRSDVNLRLTSQRDDFKAVVDPLREELVSYRKMYGDMKLQVDDLEDRLDGVQADNRLLVHDVVRLTFHVEKNLPGNTLRLHPRVHTLVERSHSYRPTEGEGT